jgi:DNA-binding cell septation regulator SpoVG
MTDTKPIKVEDTGLPTGWQNTTITSINSMTNHTYPYTMYNNISSTSPIYGDYTLYSNMYEHVKVNRSNRGVMISMPDGSQEQVSYEDLVKYISEQQLVKSNAVVRGMYDRYQVAVKLVRSDDDGDTRV